MEIIKDQNKSQEYFNNDDDDDHHIKSEYSDVKEQFKEIMGKSTRESIFRKKFEQ